MSEILKKLGIKKKANTVDTFAQTIFYFMREVHKYPLDERYIVEIKWKNWFWKIKKPYIEIIKQGLPIPLFNELMKQMNKHYENEERKTNRLRRR